MKSHFQLKHWIGCLCLLFISQVALPATMSFAPPLSDYSIIFLGDIFGRVGDVLHGTGSQLLGTIMAVFDFFILALGGVLVIYTLVVATMNTAHDGEMLGKKWSGLYVPLRSVTGIAMLVPQKTNYCLMQVFVMWVVIQGVGAADKVWTATLEYLNRGGVIVEAQDAPTFEDTSFKETYQAAWAMLSGEVCMLGLETLLTAQREEYLALLPDAGACSGNPSTTMETFCNESVPDFLATVNFSAYQIARPGAGTYTMPMPNFDADTEPVYATLNGYCGSITWNSLAKSTQESVQDSMFASTAEESMPSSTECSSDGTCTTSSTGATNLAVGVFLISRALALQQMFSDYESVATAMINNDPQINTNITANADTDFSLVAKSQFGVPYLSTNDPCTKVSSSCTLWGQDQVQSTSQYSSPIFYGSEFQTGVTDYKAVIQPSLDVLSVAKAARKNNDAYAFIVNAENAGWFMAGAYFFDMVRLNRSGTGSGSAYEENSGLGGSTFATDLLTSGFGTDTSTCVNSETLCTFFSNSSTDVLNLISLINGDRLDISSTTTATAVPLATPTYDSTMVAIKGVGTSTAYGFATDGALIQLPGQPGLDPPTFTMNVNFAIDTAAYEMDPISFKCHGVPWVKCIGRVMADVFFNNMFLYLWGYFLAMATQSISIVFQAFMIAPMEAMAKMYIYAAQLIAIPGVNPIVGLAQMGVFFINLAMYMWILMIEIAIAVAFIPWFGLYIFVVIVMMMPLVTSWLGIMLAMGFSTAYYVPFVPYTVFTFGAIAWLFTVIEAMVAAPLVSLAIAHPEGDNAFGKGEASFILLLGIMLRPSAMVVGYIISIILTYVLIWILNAGYGHVLVSSGMESGTDGDVFVSMDYNVTSPANGDDSMINTGVPVYTNWASMYLVFFEIIMYVSTYMALIQRAFTPVWSLPDKLTTWIGGPASQAGAETSQWGEESKQKISDAGKQTEGGMAQTGKQVSGYAEKAIGAAAGASGGSVSAEGS